MNLVDIKTITECGFKPPVFKYVKTDARGEEYGQYEAIPTEDGRVFVSKLNCKGDLEWVCKFENLVWFKNWAKDCT